MNSIASTACVSVFSALQCCIVGALHSTIAPSEAKVLASELVQFNGINQRSLLKCSIGHLHCPLSCWTFGPGSIYEWLGLVHGT